MRSPRTIVLEHDRVRRKIRRIAHQLLEEYHEEKCIVLVGVAPRGAQLAQRLAEELALSGTPAVTLMELKLDKDEPLSRPVALSSDIAGLKDQVVILVDDVLMSGRTLMYAAAHLVQAAPRRLSTVVLVDRMHRTFPIRADIVGLTLSTTLQEHISVELGDEDVVYLT
jgi:pyrimidine operon attenuation protein/uracil phosphoribosyltransferase